MAGITDDLNTLKTLQQGLVNNKVSRFAYEQSAYTNNDVAGHDDYVASRANNIPTSDISVMEVNQTVVDKGFRARASSMPRMLLNHFFGRISYNLNKINDLFLSVLTSILNSIGQSNGLVPLDSTGRIPYQYLPEDAVELKGTWNASTNTPTLADGTGTTGDTYIVTVAGTQDLGSGTQTFFVDDRVIYNGSAWQRFASGDVRSVCELLPDTTGNVDLSQQTDMRKIFSPSFLQIALRPLLGLSWEEQEFSSYSFRCVYCHDGVWLAGTYQHGLYRSTDGKTWTKITSSHSSSSFTTATIESILYANGIWLVGSSVGVYYSEDSMNWTQGYSVGSGYAYVHYGNGLFVSYAGSVVKWSEDGKIWTTGTISSNGTITDIYYANGIWLMSAYEGIFSSTDGKTWTRKYVNNNADPFRSVCYANGLWIVGTTNLGLYKSTDNGDTWTQIAGDLATYRIDSVTYAHGLWFAGTYEQGLWWSEDGDTWTQVSDTSGMRFTKKVYYDNLVWLALSYNQGLWWSQDGIHWSIVIPDDTAYSVFYNNSLWVAGMASGLYTSDWENIAEYFSAGGTL